MIYNTFRHVTVTMVRRHPGACKPVRGPYQGRHP